ncbi:MAG: nucleotidyltransferase family protein [Geminicoccaceae bacterium]
MEPATSREDIRRRIDGLAAELSRLGVRSLSLFGSAARDRLEADSDVDVLVEFEGPARFDPFMELKLLLEDSLGRPVDLTTTAAMKPMLRARIEPDLLRVA